MKLIEIKNWKLTVSEELWGLKPFATLLKRDKSKDKQIAIAELEFIYFYSDVRSNYLTMVEADRISELKKDLAGLPDGWEPDDVVWDCVELYSRHDTALEMLYKQTLKAAQAIGGYLENSEALLAERDVSGRPVSDINKITGAVQKVPKLMRDLKEAYKEVVKEKEDNENKKKGSKSYNVFEEGLNIE